MSAPIIVLVSEGKRESCDSVRVHLFDALVPAMVFCANTTKEGKYWTHARIVRHGDNNDLSRDEWWSDYCERTANEGEDQ